MRNITRNMSEDHTGKQWLNDPSNENCTSHRKSILNLISRARVFTFVQEYNDEIKLNRKLPFTKQTRLLKIADVDDTELMNIDQADY